MTKVFIGGSRRITRLNKSILDRTDEIVKKGHTVLVGDANGSDKLMQKYFTDKHYSHVIVFCAGNLCRNNLGNWTVRFIQSERTEKDFDFYATKDLEMSKEATYGLMLWDGKSSGTLNNILNLLEQNKEVQVYFSPKKLVIKLNKSRDLMHLVKNCDSSSLARFEKKLRLTERIFSQQQLSLA